MTSSIGEWLETRWDSAEHAVKDIFEHHSQSQAPAATTATVGTTPTGGKPVSAFAAAKSGLHDVLATLETIDEAAASKLEAIQGNPGAMALVDAALGALHVPPEGFDVVVTTLKGLAGIYAPVEAAPAAAPAA